MIGFAGLNVGKTKTGKTTFTKGLILDAIDNRPVFVYDVNNEYKAFYNDEFVKKEEFMLKVKNVKNSFIVFEEATIFFNNKACDEILQEMLVRKRHTKNIIYMNFHSFRAVPNYVFDLVDYITIFKTNDSPKRVAEKYKDDRFLKAVESVRESDNPYCRIVFDMYE
jgi:hypothetical protein